MPKDTPASDKFYVQTCHRPKYLFGKQDSADYVILKKNFDVLKIQHWFAKNCNVQSDLQLSILFVSRPLSKLIEGIMKSFMYVRTMLSRINSLDAIFMNFWKIESYRGQMGSYKIHNAHQYISCLTRLCSHGRMSVSQIWSVKYSGSLQLSIY